MDLSFLKREEKVENKPIEKLLALLIEKLEEKPVELSVMSEDEKIKAACALNLCTVSVSQIIDYNDLIILEQEYDYILNNLNLEHMPKDQALLNILKQILDTITFFRIQEGDKAIAEKKYQQKVKNAIWNAIPNFGVISVGDPYSFVAALALSAGMGYMNYRKEKAKMNLEQEEERWKLQRSAIEQFNGLRRELFDTAWRLAEKYEFHDKLRLTEKQISQFNSVLMDTNKLRRYLRLKNIEEHFEAYPPYLYHLANAAYELANVVEDNLKGQYITEAEIYYEKYRKSDFKLLREDYIRTQCSLEYVDLLYQKYGSNKIDVIKDLLAEVENSACNTFEALQICAMDYWRIGCLREAANLFLKLIAEGHNEESNAKFLSFIYLQQISQNPSLYKETLNQYEKLKQISTSVNILPYVDSNTTDVVSFSKQAKDELLKKEKEDLLYKYGWVLRSILGKHVDSFYRKLYILPYRNTLPLEDSFYLDTDLGRKIRKDAYLDVFGDNEKARILAAELNNMEILSIYRSFVNDFCADIDYVLRNINICHSQEIKNKICDSLKEDSFLWCLRNLLRENPRIEEKSADKYQNNFLRLINLSPADGLYNIIDYAKLLFERVLYEGNSFAQIVGYESKLFEICQHLNLNIHFGIEPLINEAPVNVYFDPYALLGIPEHSHEMEVDERKSKILHNVSIPKSSLIIYITEPRDIESQMENFNDKERIQIQNSGKKKLAYLYDKGSRFDHETFLIFVRDGIFVIRHIKVGINSCNFWSYDEIKFNRSQKILYCIDKKGNKVTVNEGDNTNTIYDIIMKCS